MIRMSLNEEDFNTLITGGEVVKEGVTLILKDIGYATMCEKLKKAMVKDGFIKQ